MFATKNFVIDTSWRNGCFVSIRYAECRTISLHWYSASAASEIFHWMPCLAESFSPCSIRSSARATSMSSAFSIWPIQRMQCARRAGPRRTWPSV